MDGWMIPTEQEVQVNDIHRSLPHFLESVGNYPEKSPTTSKPQADPVSGIKPTYSPDYTNTVYTMI